MCNCLITLLITSFLELILFTPYKESQNHWVCIQSDFLSQPSANQTHSPVYWLLPECLQFSVVEDLFQEGQDWSHNSREPDSNLCMQISMLCPDLKMIPWGCCVNHETSSTIDLNFRESLRENCVVLLQSAPPPLMLMKPPVLLIFMCFESSRVRKLMAWPTSHHLGLEFAPSRFLQDNF